MTEEEKNIYQKMVEIFSTSSESRESRLENILEKLKGKVPDIPTHKHQNSQVQITISS